MKEITLPPYAPMLIESTRAIGYTLESAIADIIDNSISASATRINIFYFPTEPYIAVLDNGVGMNGDELSKAMRYGSQSPNEKRTIKDLGRFGLGLKTASLSQCRTLTVVSKQGNSIEARRWDIDHVIKTDNWSLLIFDTAEELNSIPCIDALKKIKAGTLVVWQNLDRLNKGDTSPDGTLNKKMDTVRSHLSLVFHRYLNGEVGLKKIALDMNNLPVEGVDPFLTSHDTKAMDTEVLRVNCSTITIQPYLLPHISKLKIKELKGVGGKEGLRNSQGFYVYRNKRLLIWGTWFRMIPKDEFYKLARVQVDIPNELDDLWMLDIKKSTTFPPEIVRNQLKTLIENLAGKSKSTYQYRGKQETRDDIIHLWNRMESRDGLYYSVNREHPFVTHVAELLPNGARKLDTLLKYIETSLPLNILEMDLQSKQKVNNSMETNEPELEKRLQELVEQLPTKAAKIRLLDTLANTDHFASVPHLINNCKAALQQEPPL